MYVRRDQTTCVALHVCEICACLWVGRCLLQTCGTQMLHKMLLHMGVEADQAVQSRLFSPLRTFWKGFLTSGSPHTYMYTSMKIILYCMVGWAGPLQLCSAGMERNHLLWAHHAASPYPVDLTQAAGRRALTACGIGSASWTIGGCLKWSFVQSPIGKTNREYTIGNTNREYLSI